MSQPASKPPAKTRGAAWPRLMRRSPRLLITLIALWLLGAWGVFLAVDIYEWIDLGLNRPVWTLLFNDRPIEWTQWFILAAAAAMSGYLGGRLDGRGETKAGRFFTLLALGLGFMLIEDAGDIRHVLNQEAAWLVGAKIFGLPASFLVEAPYFLAVAGVPLYALARYGRSIWWAVSARFYMLGGFLLYGLAAGGSLLSNLAHSYVILGGLFDILLLGSRLPLIPGRTQEYSYFFFADSALEESIELLAITMLLAAMLAFVCELRTRAAKTARISK